MSFAFVFPGQGSQSLTMLDGLGEYQIVKDTFVEASDIIGVDLLAMLNDETAERINKTQNTQPLMLTSGVATYRVWQSLGGKMPAIMAGHSLGEYSALVCSGSLKFADAVGLVYLRATAMQNAVAEGVGAMAAVLGLDDAAVIEGCRETEACNLGVVEAVNFNSPGQVVIAGNKLAVEKASEILKAKGARKVQLLPMSVPSHCSLMRTASEDLMHALSKVEFAQPQCSVLHNYDANSYSSAVDIRTALTKQLYMPVLWTKIVHAIATSGVTTLVECGAGKVLSGLNKRINSSLISYNLNNKEDFINALKLL